MIHGLFKREYRADTIELVHDELTELRDTGNETPDGSAVAKLHALLCSVVIAAGDDRALRTLMKYAFRPNRYAFESKKIPSR